MKNVCFLFFLILCNVASAQIINFPDPNFKNALVNTKCADLDGDNIGDADADLNDDGEIDVSEALTIKGLRLATNQISSLNGIENFSNLEFLGCVSNKLDSLNVNDLHNLTYLDCSNNQIKKLILSDLKKIKELYCERNSMQFLHLNNLENIKLIQCGINELQKVTINKLPNLGTFSCYENQLDSLDFSGCTNLKKLHCPKNNLAYINISTNYKLIELYCEQNNLTNIDISNLSNLKRFECGHNMINKITLKNSLNIEHFVCNNNLIDSIDVSHLGFLTYFDCSYNKLYKLDFSRIQPIVDLDCSENHLNMLNLENLYKLNSLKCYGNDLWFLFVKTGNEIQFINFSKNSLFYICCNEIDVKKIKDFVRENFIFGCEVNSYCTFTPGGKFYILNGENTYDSDNNGCDNTDTNLANFKYNITNGSVTGSLISNSTGNYSIPVQEGTHTITPILEYPDYFQVSPSSYTITFPNTSDTITQDFCITPKGIYRQINITVLPLTPPARPGFDASYKIVWENVGNQVESGTLNFTYDETLLDYISATQTADQVADGIIKWNFSNLLPFEKREITVTLKVNRPTDTPAVNAGDKLYMTASILDNIFTLENTVVGSYDPNDKTCLQGDRVHPDMIGKYVDYLIRFENTGTYAAENVVVKDIIDTKRYDVSTLQITDASHEVYTRIEGNKVEFIFENIQLPFDDANNDGYIAFKIKTLSTLQLGDSLKNLADIYFDYNFPIRTNEAQTTVALPSFTQEWVSDVNIYPNPVSDILFLQTEETWTKAEIFDVAGRIMRAASLSSQTIDVSTLEVGTYFVRLRNGDRVGRVKFVKM